MPTGIQIDYVGRQGLNAVFGEQIVGQRVPDILVQFRHGISTFDCNLEIP